MARPHGQSQKKNQPRNLERAAAKLQHDMEQNYPVRGAGDKIEWARPQWVEGDNNALHYRGRELKRGKSKPRHSPATSPPPCQGRV